MEGILKVIFIISLLKISFRHWICYCTCCFPGVIMMRWRQRTWTQRTSTTPSSRRQPTFRTWAFTVSWRAMIRLRRSESLPPRTVESRISGTTVRTQLIPGKATTTPPNTQMRWGLPKSYIQIHDAWFSSLLSMESIFVKDTSFKIFTDHYWWFYIFSCKMLFEF